ncbi:hypothetical protein EVAR_12817_1 [Eumeta japonica]|uniref:Uncharacterized protein n=1 Tax=Eumeta variegata TaxID=151549 RepID=A0A4C1UC56_EUMVA|nr:hypothetical protein EVAR_12817_1 [Eumeta japonica]
MPLLLRKDLLPAFEDDEKTECLADSLQIQCTTSIQLIDQHHLDEFSLGLLLHLTSPAHYGIYTHGVLQASPQTNCSALPQRSESFRQACAVSAVPSDDLSRGPCLFEAHLGSHSKSFCRLGTTLAVRNAFAYAVKAFGLTARSEETPSVQRYYFDDLRWRGATPANSQPINYLSSGLKEDVVTKVERSMLRWFGHLERMNESGLTKQIYRANVCDEKVGKDRSRKSYADHIGGMLKRAKFKAPETGSPKLLLNFGLGPGSRFCVPASRLQFRYDYPHQSKKLFDVPYRIRKWKWKWTYHIACRTDNLTSGKQRSSSGDHKLDVTRRDRISV